MTLGPGTKNIAMPKKLFYVLKKVTYHLIFGFPSKVLRKWGPHLNTLEKCGLFYFFFSFYHNKIHPVTNYKAIKNKINETRQHRTNFL